MGKKLIGIAVVAIMLFGILGLAGCDNVSLADYKVAGKAKIDDHVATKTQSDYSTENWLELNNAATAGKQAVAAATSKPDVDDAVKDAKDEINAVPKTIGSFYSLQEAYDQGFLTVEDLQSIAYYLNDDSMPVYPETLSVEVERAIKETRASDLSNSQSSAGNATTADITVLAYYGSYDGSVAVMIADNFTEFGQATWTETVAGIDFQYGDGNKILVWKEGTKTEEQIVGTFYSLQEAYDAGFITRDDLMNIAFFVSGEVLDSDLARIDFATQIETPALLALEASIIDGMKTAFYEKHKVTFDSHSANVNDATVVGFLGEYSGSFAVQMTATFMEYGDGSFIENIADIAWTQFAPSIIVFVIN